MLTVEIRLIDYLGPNGKHPYERLFTDMESALDAGNRVHVVSVPGFMIAIGHPKADGIAFTKDGKDYHWTDCTTEHLYYTSAEDVIRRQNGFDFDSIW